jgi:hypothetical protein
MRVLNCKMQRPHEGGMMRSLRNETFSPSWIRFPLLELTRNFRRNTFNFSKKLSFFNADLKHMGREPDRV